MHPLVEAHFQLSNLIWLHAQHSVHHSVSQSPHFLHSCVIPWDTTTHPLPERVLHPLLAKNLCLKNRGVNSHLPALNLAADKTSRTTSFAKKSKILKPQKQKSPHSWLLSIIFSIKIMNRIGDKIQPWHSQGKSLTLAKQPCWCYSCTGTK